MMKTTTNNLSGALDLLSNDAYEIIEQEAITLHGDLVFASPVDTGFFRSLWTLRRLGDNAFRISNNAKYADVLARGRRFVNNRYEGSLQMPRGISPFIASTLINIERRTNAIKY